MRPHSHRTAAAAVCTATALGLPCLAWFVTGSSAARQEASRLAEAPVVHARRDAERIAQGLAIRLESLRQSESRRSFLDYREHGHPPDSDCSCEPPLGSPLAQGPADPLVWAHFQIDEVGQLSLPGLAAEELRLASWEREHELLAMQQAILDKLECDAAERLASRPDLPESVEPLRASPAVRELITVGPLQWETISVDEQPALVALREVHTPAATLVQGFVIRREGLEELMQGAPYPTEARPGVASRPTEARIPFEGEPWCVAVDASRELAEAQRDARRVEARFYRTFAAGLLAALVAGGLVVGLVAQADGLARQRSRFAAAAAHELRTPLAGLRLYGEMLAEGIEDPARSRTYANRIAGEAERLARVVSNVLGFSQLERSGLAVRAEPGDLGHAVRESVEKLRAAIEMGGAGVELSIDPVLPAVRFDAEAVHQILQNLLDNAEKYNRSAVDRTIHVAVAPSGKGAALSVTDHGRGVPSSIRRKLFRAFVRHDSPDAPAGLGLGLSLVQALARAQRATVSYEEPAVGGSRFTVKFA